MACSFRRPIDPLVRDVAARREEFTDGAVLLLLGSEIDVGKDALGILKEMQIVWALEAIGDRAQDSKANTLRLRIADEIEGLVHELQVKTWISRHFSHVCLLGLPDGVSFTKTGSHVLRASWW